MARLRITADDYGLAPEVNHGIEELARRGAIDAVSVMAHRGAHLDSLPNLLSTGVLVGIHLVFVEELPLTQSRYLAPLVRQGRLPPSFWQLFQALLCHPIAVQGLLDEAEAQLEGLTARGILPKFVNSHQHVHLFPPVWKALSPLLERLRLPVRAATSVRLSPLKQFSVEVASALSLRDHPLASGECIHPLGIEAAGDMRPAVALRAGRRARTRPSQQFELVVHPGHRGPFLDASYSHWGYQWESEYEFLSAGTLRERSEEA